MVCFDVKVFKYYLCFVRKDGPTVLTILMDSAHPNRVRQKAAEMIGDIGEVEAIEPLRNAK